MKLNILPRTLKDTITINQQLVLLNQITMQNFSLRQKNIYILEKFTTEELKVSFDNLDSFDSTINPTTIIEQSSQTSKLMSERNNEDITSFKIGGLFCYISIENIGNNPKGTDNYKPSILPQCDGELIQIITIENSFNHGQPKQKNNEPKQQQKSEQPQNQESSLSTETTTQTTTTQTSTVNDNKQKSDKEKDQEDEKQNQEKSKKTLKEKKENGGCWGPEVLRSQKPEFISLSYDGKKVSLVDFEMKLSFVSDLNGFVLI